MSIGTAIKSIAWARGLFEEIYSESPGEVPLGEDNVGAQLNCSGPRKFSTSRHFAITAHYVVEELKGGTATVYRCPGKVIIADFFTKPLEKTDFFRLLDKLMVVKETPLSKLET